MAAHIVGKVASQITLFGYHLQVAAQARSLRNEEQFSVLSLAAVLFDNSPRYVQQLDVALRFRFLTGDVNPLAAVLLRDDVVLCQVRQVCPSDASESRKDEQVPRMAQSVRGQLGFQQLLELLIRQVAVVSP